MATPIEIKLHKHSKTLDVAFDDGKTFCYSAEFLRVYSPSAEVAGHAGEPRTWVLDKQNVGILRVEPVGQYAIKIVFDDGHQTGLYSWDTLYDYGVKFDALWAAYQAQLS